MRVVEFVGPAGVGKTTIANAIINPGRGVKGKPYHVGSLYGLLMAPQRTYRAVRFLWRAGRWRSFSKTGLNWLIVAGALFQAKQQIGPESGVMIFDQLVVQALRRLAREFGTTATRLAAEYRADIEVADLIICVMSPGDVVKARRMDRGGAVGRGFCQSGNWCSQLDTRRAVRLLAGDKQAVCVIVDGRKDVKVNRKLIADFIFENNSAN